VKNSLSRRKFMVTSSLLAMAGLGWMVADDPTLISDSESQLPSWMIPLVYSSHYNVTLFGLEKLHPFDGRKFDKIKNHLVNEGLRSRDQFLKPSSISEEQLRVVHSKDYLDSLSCSEMIAHILEMPSLAYVPAALIDWRVLAPMRLASGGTLLTCKLALKHGIAINIGGGYHHAEKDRGGGFCVYSDVPVAINVLRQEELIKKAMIVDTDAHQGNGFSNATRNDPSVFVVDFFDETIYPYPKVEETWSVPFPAQTPGNTYLYTLADVLPKAVNQFKPDLIIHNAGSDVLATDPLSTFRLAVEDVNERDLYVAALGKKLGIPVAMVLAGGYSKESAEAHAKSIHGILKRFEIPA
jgi:histone deacetylase 11